MALRCVAGNVVSVIVKGLRAQYAALSGLWRVPAPAARGPAPPCPTPPCRLHAQPGRRAAARRGQLLPMTALFSCMAFANTLLDSTKARRTPPHTHTIRIGLKIKT